MKIITCIKQVPASSEVEIDSKTGNLVRDGNNVKMNPFDLFALEAAFKIKELKEETVIHSVSMGPNSSIKVLEEALAMGSDMATLISDRRFAGADVLATSYTLSQLIKTLSPFDLVICGKQTTDGDTAQVGPEIAEFLGIPHVPYVAEIIEIADSSVVLKSVYDDYDEVVRVSFPCLITIEKDAFVPRLPSYLRKIAKKSYQIPTVSLANLEDVDPSHYGLSGSPTQVEEIFPPNTKVDSKRIIGDSNTLAEQLLKILKENKFL